MLTFDHGWYCTPRSGCRQGTEMGSAAILEGTLWLTPEESAGQRLWRGQRHHNRLRATSGRRNQREQTQSPPIPTCVLWNFRMWLWRTPGYGGWPLIKLNSFHNNNWIELIIMLSIFILFWIIVKKYFISKFLNNFLYMSKFSN